MYYMGNSLRLSTFCSRLIINDKFKRIIYMKKLILVFIWVLLLSSCHHHLQGSYVSRDCALYKELIFEGKNTVTIIDGIFGFPFSTSYVLDEDILRIKTDRSDLVFKIKDSQTLIGEGFAAGTFIKSN